MVSCTRRRGSVGSPARMHSVFRTGRSNRSRLCPVSMSASSIALSRGSRDWPLISEEKKPSLPTIRLSTLFDPIHDQAATVIFCGTQSGSAKPAARVSRSQSRILRLRAFTRRILELQRHGVVQGSSDPGLVMRFDLDQLARAETFLVLVPGRTQQLVESFLPPV